MESGGNLFFMFLSGSPFGQWELNNLVIRRNLGFHGCVSHGKMVIIIWHKVLNTQLQMFHQLTLGELCCLICPPLLCVGFSATPATSFVSLE